LENAGIPQIDVDDLEGRLAAGAPLLDVRNPDEYAEARVAGAVLIPLGELADRLDEVPSGAPVLVICRSGARSQRACEFLAAHGQAAANVAGGMLAWAQSGRPVESGPG
jgi:rhodanese-related sulfurtransferase